MAQIAQVLVDVPTMQTDRPYSYQIPTAWQSQVQPGMRVVVPFGRGKRRVQGLVLKCDDVTTFDGDLKAIDAVVDLAPVLNHEGLELSAWLAQSTFAFQITCAQTMLPAVMRAKYVKILRPTATTSAQVQQDLFATETSVVYDQVATTPEAVSRLLRLQAAGEVDVYYQVKNQARKKTIMGIKATLSAAEFDQALGDVRKGAAKQVALLNGLQTLNGEVLPQKDFEQRFDVSDAVIRTGVQKGWLKKQPLEVYRDPYATADIQATKPLTLNDEQQVAVDQITAAVNQPATTTFLLEGVTGSGKTEVYLQSIAAVLAQGKTALMLVPEISLTPQMVQRVKGRFGKAVAVLHSGLSSGEKYDEWRRIKRHEAQVVVGARSAVFAPLDNIGLIIMDEEHESSYKQDDAPRYHARQVALWRSQYHHCPVVLGSATPSLESRARAEKGVYQRLVLADRVNKRPLPKVSIIDMKNELQKHAESNFSQALLVALQDRLDRHEQSVLMLNRRGYSSFVLCRDCGFVLKCPNCDISLTLHMDTHTMKCHYCGHEEAIPRVCPNCHSRQIRYYGTGTEKVEEELRDLLPDARIIRMDNDTTRKKGAHAKLLTRFGSGEADILIGTQMIAKGLDFPNVTLVGVLNADTALGLPDFRASERTFQLLTQVSGRAGRAEKTGHVYIQTFNPDHYAIRFAQHHDYEGFFKYEMRMRHQGGYPPYYFTVQLTASDLDEAIAAKRMYQLLQWLKPRLTPNTVILGPTPKPIARVNRRYYYQIVIKYKQDPNLTATLSTLLQETQAQQRQGLQIAIDVEPLHFM
ncbi:primosomal protein N' [Lactiplantibacillus mudanjiangensis]|uniref:Replication restart protein PriA n=1 Tax=Lactiplantibacillus mudanjiangensis TaxID=1296538 RepID=A0A660EB94_9LACO|nr:primosomal protein N' [Lactiplantibacillus mudanjiangensis]VDG24515.1 primosomal protein N' [Lactobacillus sp.] [Lactiplantibacillus mudanjiangensis]VDG29806.1 primosomal protein N' [Lactobacillus sp.] [Lactiplantibacillus mudanjiangensis]VDG31230.1 primosomal protein N' [Lactobacillus sp.] [Lactiplantibacillus mudanjiangensis]